MYNGCIYCPNLWVPLEPWIGTQRKANKYLALLGNNTLLCNNVCVHGTSEERLDRLINLSCLLRTSATETSFSHSSTLAQPANFYRNWMQAPFVWRIWGKRWRLFLWDPNSVGHEGGCSEYKVSCARAASRETGTHACLNQCVCGCVLGRRRAACWGTQHRGSLCSEFRAVLAWMPFTDVWITGRRFSAWNQEVFRWEPSQK